MHNLYTWGKGSRGKLGHEDENDENSPKLVKAFAYQPIKNIAAGYWQSMAISDEGLYIWGSTKNGQLGIGETGEDQLRPTLLPGLKDLNLIKIAASDGFSVAISGFYNFHFPFFTKTIFSNRKQMLRTCTVGAGMLVIQTIPFLLIQG